MKIAVITGASSGIGREFSFQIEKLYRNLDEIWIVARRTLKLQELGQEISLPVHIFDGDMQREYIYERIKKELDKKQADIRILVNAAGYGKTGRFCEIDEQEELGMIDLNCKALTKMTYLCLPYMSEGSRIIQIASAAAFAPQPGFAVYAASKSYVYHFSLALKEELRGKNISVTTVCPGPVDTEFFRRSGELPNLLKASAKANVKRVVKQALTDAVHRKSVSVYGMTMKSTRFLAKIVPETVAAFVMKKINKIEK